MTRAVTAILLMCVIGLRARPESHVAPPDSDQDGLTDQTEKELLQEFQPQWMIAKGDCSVKPAQFALGVSIPSTIADNGTIYGQASRYRGSRDEVELHFYHLWRQDCGEMGHALDAEHVAVLVRREAGVATARWKALYWYAASHEDTVCDASQITRATTIGAEEKGATVWISPAKHASFLSEELCHYGCGGDHCNEMVHMKPAEVINLGELSRLPEGMAWASSKRWPLADKMRRTDFSEARIERLSHLPETDVAWANPARRPAQAAIFGGNAAINGVATGGRSTDIALVVANGSTGRALSKAQQNTGNALTKSYRNVVKALDGAKANTGKALGIEGKEKPSDSNER